MDLPTRSNSFMTAGAEGVLPRMGEVKRGCWKRGGRVVQETCMSSNGAGVPRKAEVLGELGELGVTVS